MEIREIAVGERDRVLELARAFLKQSPYESMFPPKDGAIDRLMTMTQQWGIVLVAHDGVDIRGIIAGVIVEHPLTGHLYAEEVVWYVEPEARASGCGLQLLVALRDWATTNGANMLKMLAPAESPVGKLLERQGFVRVETAFMKLLTEDRVAVPVSVVQKE